VLPTALITGAAGQDGFYLANHLGRLGYKVAGILQPGEHRNLQRDLGGSIDLVTGDMTDMPSLLNAIRQVQPDEVYNLAAVSSVRTAWEQPNRAADVNGLGLVNLLEALRALAGGRASQIRVFQASSAQIFGDVDGDWFTEETPIRPISPYGAAKAFAHFAADAYRREYGMFVSCGILGNHESPLHDADFVIPRITQTAGRIAAGLPDKLVLDNLTATRDWGYAGDFVVAMHAALQHDRPEDFVIATGELHSVAEAVEAAFAAAGIADWQAYVSAAGVTGRRAQRGVRGNINKTRRLLGWTPTVDFGDLMAMMVKHYAERAAESGHCPTGMHGTA
jgi:GDPmannose 4,6-dehydratase